MYIALMVLLVILLVSLGIGGPVSTTIGFTACIGMIIYMGASRMSFLGSITYTNAINPNNLVIPLFILMAEFMTHGGVAEDVFSVLAKYLRKVKGGLAIATTLACTVFAALCGSSPATAATLGRISIKEMVKRGYREDFAVGTVAGGGTLGIMIPPSVTLAMFGILTETSIVKLLMAGLLPGVMLSLLMVAMSYFRVRLNPELVNAKASENLKKHAENEIAETVEAEYKTTVWQDIVMAAPAAILIAFLLIAMYTGIATATECAAIGCLAAFIIVLARRKLTKKVFSGAMTNTMRVSCHNLLSMTAGLMLSNVIARLGIATAMAEACVNLGVNRWVVMILLFALWYFLGCIMSPTSMVVLTVPFVFPSLVQLGFDPYWIGITSTLCVEVGMITPPVGGNLFILKQTVGTDMGTIIRGAFPYVACLTAGLIILCVFPDIATIIPAIMS